MSGKGPSLTAVIRHPLTGVVVQAVWCDDELVVRQVLVGSAARSFIDKAGVEQPADVPEMEGIRSRITAFLNGSVNDLTVIPIDTKENSAFRSAVSAAARKIPYGTTVTYSQLAVAAGFPGAVRAAASVMRRNRLPLLIPCHRVVRKDGSIGGYCSVREGADALLKRRLIALEASVIGAC